MPDPAAKDPQPIGQSWLRRELCLPVPPAGSESFVLAGARRTEIRGSNAVEFYPRQYATDNTIVGHLRFALRHEPLDLGIIAGTMKAVDPAILQQWLRREPTGVFSRRAWFFLNCLPDAPWTFRILEPAITSRRSILAGISSAPGEIQPAIGSRTIFWATSRSVPRSVGRPGSRRKLRRGSMTRPAPSAICTPKRRVIHPFEDGNGRLHRFLIHAILAKRKFSPPEIVFPVSAAILRDRQRYDSALEAFSGAVAPLVLWRWTSEQKILVENNTDDLYRDYDATPQAEYLYDRVVDTVRQDLKQELGFVAVFDRALQGVGEVVDMPDRRASLFVRLCIQNGGRLAGGRRTNFAELTDTEITAMEAAVQRAIAAEADHEAEHEL